MSKLHDETTRARQQAEVKKAQKTAMMKERLKKVRDRKRLRMGLPMLEDNEEEEKQTDVSEDVGAGEEKDKSLEESVMEGLKSLRKEKEEAEKEARRKAFVREWDKGKEGVMDKPSYHFLKGEKKIMSQSEWVDEKRKMRPGEFAPPSIYTRASGPPKPMNKKSHQAKDNPSTNLPDFSVPPPKFPKQRNQGSKCNPMQILEKTQATSIGPEPRPSDWESEMVTSEPEVVKQQGVSLKERLAMFNDHSNNQPDDEIDERNQSKGAEIAPPCSMDYYSAGTSKNRKTKFGFRSQNEMESAFSDGLNRLKNKRPKTDSDSE